MQQSEEFNQIASYTDYKTIGDGLDYAVFYDDENKRIVLMFQESNGKVDWRTNLNFLFHKDYIVFNNVRYAVKIHGGYWRAWESARSAILLELLDNILTYNCYNLYIKGWSYGAAMANIALFDIYKYFTELKISVDAFASANVFFNKKTAELLNNMATINNYGHVNDLVAHIPYGYVPNRIIVGKSKKKWYRIFNPNVWHCIYGDQSIYEDL